MRRLLGVLFSLVTAIPFVAVTCAEAMSPTPTLPMTFKTTLVPGNQYFFTFRLFDAPSGGTELWTETTPKKLTVSPTRTIQWSLGSVVPFSDGLTGPVDFSLQLWVQITGGGKTPTRTRLTMVPYALWSAGADGLVAGNGCSLGQILFRSDTGWECGTIRAFANGIGICAEPDCFLTCTLGWGNCDESSTNGCEVPLNTPAHCGSCGNECVPASNMTASCRAGLCQYECGALFGNCDANLVNGCERSLAADVNNCGACGLVCADLANTVRQCTAGQCGYSCTAPYADCNLLAADGCEMNLTSSASNCGSCGVVCPARANATSTCSGSICGFACLAGWANCNGNAADGCEINLTSNVGNCGGCGVVCPGRPNATAGCSGSACRYYCDAFWRDCNGSATDGCETSYYSASNCGGCGVVCPARANATATCSGLSGTCGFNCSTGWGDCNLLAADGCEAFLNTDPFNCGACGRVCTSGLHLCSGGTCF